MNIKDFLCFIQWYFDYIGKKRFDNSPPKIQTVTEIKRRERLPVIIFAYLLMMASLLLFLTVPPAGYLLSIALMMEAIVLLYLCQFSFVYYFLVYIKYSNKNSSINDRVIVEECALLDSTNDIRKTISKYFRVIDVRRNIFGLKYDLVEKSKRYKKLSKRDLSVLKITPNKIFFNKQEVFSHKITDLSDLEAFLQEAQKQVIENLKTTK